MHLTLPLPLLPFAAPGPAGGRFHSEVKQLQGELWDDDISLDYDSMMGEQRDKVGGAPQAALSWRRQLAPRRHRLPAVHLPVLCTA